MRAGRAEWSELRGSQTPTHRLVPPEIPSLLLEKTPLGLPKISDPAQDCLDMAALVGIVLDEWQRNALIDGLRVNEHGKWEAFEVVLEIARQNGKSVILDVLALTALYVWRLKTIVYSAHEGTTAMEAFQRLEELIKGCPQLRAETPDRSFHQANGKEKIRIATGRILFKTRTAGGGRGLSGDLVIADEAQALVDSHIAAVFPTLRARPNPQIWYAGSAGNQKSTVLGRLVRRIVKALASIAKDGTNPDPRLCGIRFAGNENDDPADPRVWAKTNPALGRRVDVEWMAGEYRSLPPSKFAEELLCIGDYPRDEGEDWIIPGFAWSKTTDDTTELVGKVVYAIDATRTQSWSAIAAAGPAERSDEKTQRTLTGGTAVEVIEHARGVRWIPGRLAELCGAHENDGVVLDAHGPLVWMVPELEELGIKVHLIETTKDLAAAWGWFYDAATQEQTLWHRNATDLTASLASAQLRDIGGGTAPKRAGAADVSPLYAAFMAGAKAASKPTPSKPTPKPRRASHREPVTRQAPARRGRRGGGDIATTNF